MRARALAWLLAVLSAATGLCTVGVGAAMGLSTAASLTAAVWPASALARAKARAGEPGVVRLCAVGDLLFDRGVRTARGEADPAVLLAKVAPFIARHDLAFGNLECPLAPPEVGFQLPKRFSFRCDPEVAAGLHRVGFDALQVANNHTVDRGREGFAHTLDALRAQGLGAVGGGRTQDEALRPVVMRKNGLTVAMFGAVGFVLEATTRLRDQPGPAWDLEGLVQGVRRARNRVDVVVVGLHWGAEGHPLPGRSQVELGHRLIDAGADLVLGHHPHVLQSVEHYKGRWIVYSLGNFVFDNSGPWQRRSAMLSVELRRGQVSRPTLWPVEIVGHSPRPVVGAAARKIQTRIRSLSRAYDATATLGQGGRVSLSALGSQQQADPADGPHLRRWRPPGSAWTVTVHPGLLRLHHAEQGRAARSLPLRDPRQQIRDADISVEAVGGATRRAWIFAVIGPPGRSRGERLAVFPIDLEAGRFGTPMLDSHADFRPWRVRVADLDGDGRDEVLLGVFKATRYDKRARNRLFVYNHRQGRPYPRWLGSQLAAPLEDFSTARLDSKGAPSLVTWGTIDGKGAVFRHRWNGFGFDGAARLAAESGASDLIEILWAAHAHEPADSPGAGAQNPGAERAPGDAADP